MSDLLELPDQELHCCIKAFPDDQEYRDRVITWARSIPQDTHDDDKKLDGNHRIENNSVYAAIMARPDGKNSWRRAHPCFSCNDLTSLGPKFACSRENWENHYNSTIVFPLRYVVDSPQKTFYTIGFLCFYSKRKNVFPDMPNIFEYVGKYDEYIAQLEKNCIFQVGACMADTLSTFLRTTYEQGKLNLRKQATTTEANDEAR